MLITVMYVFRCKEAVRARMNMHMLSRGGPVTTHGQVALQAAGGSYIGIYVATDDGGWPAA